MIKGNAHYSGAADGRAAAFFASRRRFGSGGRVDLIFRADSQLIDEVRKDETLSRFIVRRPALATFPEGDLGFLESHQLLGTRAKGVTQTNRLVPCRTADRHQEQLVRRFPASRFHQPDRVAGPLGCRQATKVKAFDAISGLVKLNGIQTAGDQIDDRPTDATRQCRPADVFDLRDSAFARLQHAAAGLLELLTPPRILMGQSDWGIVIQGCDQGR